MLLPTSIKDDGDLDTPFDWYPPSPLRVNSRNELNIYLGFLLEEGNGPTCISTIHVTSRWLRGRYAETFWNLGPNDSREWDKDDTRRGEVVGYVPGTWDQSRYTLPVEIRVRLGIAWLLVRNFDEAMVLPPRKRVRADGRDNSRFWRITRLRITRIYIGMPGKHSRRTDIPLKPSSISTSSMPRIRYPPPLQQ
jgi:hypothetical protein